ncbi:dihydroxyacetone phosphate acyltransferase-like isoform X1 [Acropora millepora]|uniref:dihydroxyacetone phosphate acyltransferase-like isoform X1 n=1 Tax=Acropora millepora TaxID=45264 RepID=UPI001CF3E545|nr:dihydroxyacetone phosphate acyltransferase-like isoform X1 [Acropora millepora]
MEPFDMDLLKEGGWSDVLWSLKRYYPQRYKFAVSRTCQQIKDDVLNSRRVQHAIHENAEERGVAIESVADEVKGILEEMGHNFNLSAIRTMAFMLRKILCTLFRRVLVNREGLERLRDAAKNNPVVFIPSHRSYLDFLLVSYICFATDIPLPFIAAAADFMNMRVVHTLLRNSGAFYMRRSFMSDPLYWVVFTEYIENQLQYGDQPLEFFLEGTRSRTGKFLPPKLGILSMVVDSYTTCRVPDISICPISISYDRIPEESLYAYELLGIPKPKESLRGLIKSRSVLSEDYGSIHVYIGELVPLSRFVDGKINRVNNACIPRHLFHFLSEEEKRVVKSLGYKILNDLQTGMICPSSVLVAAIMLQNLKGIFFDELVEKFTWLKELCHMWSVPVKSAGDSNNATQVNESVDSLKLSLEKNDHGFIRLRDNKTTDVKDEGTSAKGNTAKSSLPPAASATNIKDEAAVHMLLACKRNVLLFYFFRAGLFSLAAERQQASEKQLVPLFTDFEFLARLLVKEVPQVTQDISETFEYFRETTDLLEQHGSVSVRNNKVVILQDKDIAFSAEMWRPILTAYWIACQYFMNFSAGNHERSLAEIMKELQDKAAELVLIGDVKFYEVLSLDLLRNSVSALVDLGVVIEAKSADGKGVISVPDSAKVADTYQRIGEFLDCSSNSTLMSSTLSKL